MPKIGGQIVNSAGMAIDRRRPGRRTDTSPDLIAIMRHPAGDGIMPDGLSGDRLDVEPAISPGTDPISPVRGIAVGLVLSVPLWCVVGAVGLALTR